MAIYNRIIPSLIIASSVVASFSCRKADKPPDADQHPTLRECLGEPRQGIDVGDKSDPMGNGGDQVGLGFWHGASFVRVDRFDVVKIKGTRAPISKVEVKSHTLHGVNTRTGRELSPADWKDAVLVGQVRCTQQGFEGRTRDVELQVREVPAPKGLGPLEYRLAITSPEVKELTGGTQLLNACRDPDDDAFPIGGYWDEKGNYIRDARRFSFICTQHSAARCLQRGYLDDSGSEDIAALFEACVHMMRAHYCRDGRSYTAHDTLVTFSDNRNITQKHEKSSDPEHPDPFRFEGAWSKKGLVCMARPRFNTGGLEPPQSCLKDVPPCADLKAAAELAERMAPAQPVLFNGSCDKHPCEVHEVTKEPATPVGSPSLTIRAQPIRTSLEEETFP